MPNDSSLHFGELLCREARLAAASVLAERGFTGTFIDGAVPGEAYEYFAARVPVWAWGTEGGLDVCVPSHVARLLMPPELPLAPTRELLLDVVGELSNLLAGRLKLRLLREGYELKMASPTSRLVGAGVLTFGGSSSLWFACAGRAGAVHVRVAVDPLPARLPSNRGARAVAGEGEILLF